MRRIVAWGVRAACLGGMPPRPTERPACCAGPERGGLLGGTAAQADRTPGALRRTGWKPSGEARAHPVMPHCRPACPSYATKPLDSMKKRIKRILAWGLFSLTLLVGSGILLADRLMPPATGAPGMVLPVVP